MKTYAFIVAFFLCSICVLAQDITYNKTVDEIWGGRVFMELDGKYAGTTRNDTYTTWPTDDRTVMVYCLRVPKGHVRADVVFTPRAGKTITFNLRVVRASTGELITENTCSVECKTSAEQTVELLPDFEFPADTWYRFEVISPRGNSNISQFTKWRFQRKSSLAVGDSPIYMAPSVHLLTYGSTDIQAPKGEAYDWIYQEAMILPEDERPSTYAMVIGTDGGYSGFQSIYNGKGGYTRLILFSVWDNADVDKDPAIPEYLKSGVVDIGKDVVAVRFGAEGTGASARLLDKSWWTPGKWVQFLWNARPEQVQVTLKGHDGKDSIANYQNTLETCWYKMEDATEWHYLGTLRESGRNHLYSGFYAFLENFYDIGGELMHRAYYRNAAMRSAASGKWYARNSVDFGHTQNDGTRFSRKDYGHGVTSRYENCFYLQTGGFGDICDSASVLPLPQSSPWVDTINVQALTDRIEEAIRKDEASQAASRLEMCRRIDMTTMTLVKCSDEEAEGEGENGRAAQAIDGFRSTYWHSRWKTSKAAFPHYLILDAGEEITISGIVLYQDKTSGYRAKTYRIQTSDDGKTWRTRRSGTFADDNNPEISFGTEYTSRYFKIEFLSSYGGDVLAINEIIFTTPYSLPKMMNTARTLIQMADRLGGYRKSDLQDLIAVYNDGNCTDAEGLKEALAALGNAMPLKYGVVKSIPNIRTSRCYQLHNVTRKSVLYADADNMQTTLVPDGEEDAMDSCVNWLVLKSEQYQQYCIYNVKTGLYLTAADGKLVLDRNPLPIKVIASGTGFRIGGLTDTYQMLDNYSMAPTIDFAFAQLEKSEYLARINSEMEDLCSEAVQTYGQAFNYSVATQDHGRSSARWSSNVNTTNNSSHPISHLCDGNKNTYYETWYSGIVWPAENSYIQLRFMSAQSAIQFRFTPSQNVDYGLSDLPVDITVLASADMKTWEQVAHLTEGFPSSISETYTSPVISFGKPCRAVRFQVNRTYGNRGGNPHIFAVSEMNVYGATENQETSLYYRSEAVQTAIDTMMNVLEEARAAMNQASVSLENYTQLRNAIDEALRAMQQEQGTAIGTVSRGPYTFEEIYDLQGRRLLVPSGVNIIRCSDGKIRKVITR